MLTFYITFNNSNCEIISCKANVAFLGQEEKRDKSNVIIKVDPTICASLL